MGQFEDDLTLYAAASAAQDARRARILAEQQAGIGHAAPTPARPARERVPVLKGRTGRVLLGAAAILAAVAALGYAISRVLH